MTDDPKINYEWTDGEMTFRIVRFIDEGGMGEVYEGLVTVDGKQQRCAIKMLHKRRKRGGSTAYDPNNLEKRFDREIAMLQRFDSPNIVRVISNGFDEMLGHYYAMEFIPEGQTLATIAAQGPIPLDQGELYLRHTLEALKLFAKDNMIHRDIKPQNIMVRVFVAKVADFGLGKLLSGDLSEITTTGTSMGTPSCMSPEQVTGNRDITPKCDIYSTGATFFQVLAGEVLFPDSTIPIEMATAHITQTPKWFKERGIDLPDQLEDLLVMMIDKDPDLRPSAEQAMAFLDEKSPAATDLEPIRKEISGMERPLWRRLGVADSAQLAQRLETEPDAVKTQRDAIPDARLGRLANLHEQAALRTARYEPVPVRRVEHFLLAHFYRTEIGPLPADDMLPKRLALEKRRVEMIGRRIAQLKRKVAASSAGAEASTATKNMKTELTRLKAFQQRVVSAKVAAPSPAPSRPKRLAPLVAVVAVVLVALAVVGGMQLMSNSNRAGLNRQIDVAEVFVTEGKREPAHEALAKAKDLVSQQWYWGDVAGERNRIVLLNQKLGRVELGLAGTHLEAARRKLAALSDPTREGAADTAELIRLALGKADEAIERAARCGVATEAEAQKTVAQSLRRQYERRKAQIPAP